MRKAIAALMLLAPPTAAGCFEPGGSTGACGSYYVDFDAGSTLYGVNLAAWLEPYWGTNTGTLTWAAGGETTVVMTTSPTDTQPIVGQCNGGRVTQIDGNGVIAFTSGDEGLDLSVQTGVGGDFPATPGGEPVASAFGPSAISVPPPAGLAAHLAIDPARYSTQSYFLFAINWPEGTTKPQGASLVFHGIPLQASSSMDQVVVATITFP